MPSNFLNLISRLFWPQVSGPRFKIESVDVHSLERPLYRQVNVTARLEGQIPADQCAWLVEFISESEFHPKRPLVFAFAWQRYISESYITSGDPDLHRRAVVLIIPRSSEPVFWEALSNGRTTGTYRPFLVGNTDTVAQVGVCTVAAVGPFYYTGP